MNREKQGHLGTTHNIPFVSKAVLTHLSNRNLVHCQPDDRYADIEVLGDTDSSVGSIEFLTTFLQNDPKRLLELERQHDIIFSELRRNTTV